MKILIFGGAGYIGTKLTSLLLKSDFSVTVFDRLLFGGDHLLFFNESDNFKFIKGDIRDEKELAKVNIPEYDLVIHLASIVGYPACRANPKLATTTNIDGTKNILKLLKNDQKIIFASTGSNYGTQTEIVDENSKLNPLSLYAETKVINEQLIRSRDNHIVYRFATAFGSSPRMRLDLLINDFAFKALHEGYLVVYEKKHQRSFIHINDIASSILFAVNNFDKMKNDVFNIGDESLNYSKEEICLIIKQKLPKVYIHFAEFDKDVDQRNYIVSYKKINDAGFRTSMDLNTGLDELFKSFVFLHNKKKYSNI